MSTSRIVVLASGSGSLFQALVDSRAELDVEISALITDGEVPACDRARAAGIKVEIHPMVSERDIWNDRLIAKLRELNPDLIVSAGFMKILGSKLVAEFEGKIINTHPALLPNFPGAHAVRDALVANATKTGTTIHFVDAGVDTGAIIAQREVEVLETDTESILHERIKIVERELLIEVVKQISQGKVRYEDGKVVTA